MATRRSNRKNPLNRYTAAEKLICLIALLSDKRWHTVSYLASQFAVCERTILRDLDKIENAAKVFIERKPGRGVRLESKYEFKGVEAGPEEAINLILAVAFSPKVGFSLPQVAMTLDKLRDSLPAEFASQVDWFRSRFHFDIPEYENGLKFLELIRTAILECRKIHVSHTSVKDGTTDEHDINPYGQVYYHDNWYLIGFDFKSAERRVFRIDNFKTCELLDQKFELPEKFNAQDHWYKVFWKQYEANAETVILEVDTEYEEYFKVWDSVTFDKSQNGKTTVTFKAISPEWLKSLVLSAGRHVKVIKPEWLREVITNEIESLLNIYK